MVIRWSRPPGPAGVRLATPERGARPQLQLELEMVRPAVDADWALTQLVETFEVILQ